MKNVAKFYRMPEWKRSTDISKLHKLRCLPIRVMLLYVLLYPTDKRLHEGLGL